MVVWSVGVGWSSNIFEPMRLEADSQFFHFLFFSCLLSAVLRLDVTTCWYRGLWVYCTDMLRRASLRTVHLLS